MSINPGLRLELMRRKNNLTQEEVADIIGVSRNTVMAYEKGKSPIPITIFIRLAKLYDCEVIDIFGVNTNMLVADVPVIELFKAQAEYTINRERRLNNELGMEMPEVYYEEKYKKAVAELEKKFKDLS